MYERLCVVDPFIITKLGLLLRFCNFLEKFLLKKLGNYGVDGGGLGTLAYGVSGVHTVGAYGENGVQMIVTVLQKSP